MAVRTTHSNFTGQFTRFAFFATVHSITVVLYSCSPGSGGGLADNGRLLGESGGGVPLIAEFGSIEANVLTPTCFLFS